MSTRKRHRNIYLAGVDLAWQSERNPTAVAFGILDSAGLTVVTVEPAVYGIEHVLSKLLAVPELQGISIDAPTIINNASGQRCCETGIGKVYGSRHASCHTSNTKLYPDARSVYLSNRLQERGFDHLTGDHWQIECYPHPAIIEIFDLNERLKYKKGKVAEKKAGQKQLAQMILALKDSKLLSLDINQEAMEFLDPESIDCLAGQRLKSNEDALDSIICLYIAGLYAEKRNGQTFGDVETGYVWVPQCVCI